MRRVLLLIGVAGAAIMGHALCVGDVEVFAAAEIVSLLSLLGAGALAVLRRK